MSAAAVPDQAKGFASILSAALFGSWFGVLMRLVGHYGVFGAICFRSSVQALLFLTLLLGFRGRKLFVDVSNLGVSGFLAAAAMAGQNLGISCGVLMTTVSNVFFCINTAPAVCVIVDVFVLRERVPVRTRVMVLTCLTGVLIIFVGTWQTGGSVLGILVCLVNPCSWATYWAIQRGRAKIDAQKVRDDLPVVLTLAQMLLVVVSLAASAAVDDGNNNFLGLARAAAHGTELRDVCVFLLFGGLYLPALQWLFSLAPRYIPTAQVACGKVTETLWAPLWIYLVEGEKPGMHTLAGGGLVLIAILGHSAATLREAWQNTENQAAGPIAAVAAQDAAKDDHGGAEAVAGGFPKRHTEALPLDQAASSAGDVTVRAEAAEAVDQGGAVTAFRTAPTVISI